MLLWAGLAPAVRAADSHLRIGLASGPVTADPHFYGMPTNSMVMDHVFEALVGRRGNATLFPLLAESWEAVDPHHWRFKLRPGVLFHNGAPFHARDVVYSVCRARLAGTAAGVARRPALLGVVGIEIIDSLTVLFKTAQPAPELPYSLSSLAMISSAADPDAALAIFGQ